MQQIIYNTSMQCIICSKEFEAKRADARFCSSTCRSTHARSATDSIATVIGATDKITYATDNYSPYKKTAHLNQYTNWTRQDVEDRAKEDMELGIKPYYPNWYNIGADSRDTALNKTS